LILQTFFIYNFFRPFTASGTFSPGIVTEQLTE
jgi:hypothetical protein